MSIVPKLLCPPDYSILALRFTECKKLGIVKGITTLLSYDLSNFFIPLTNFAEKRFTIKAGKTKKLSIDDIAVYWELQETYEFVATDPQVADGTSHTFEMFDEDGQSLGTLSFTVDAADPDYEDFATAFATALSSSGNAGLAGLITAEYSTTEDSYVQVTAKAKGVKYTYLLTYDVGSPALTYEHPGTLVTGYLKYPEGRVRAIFIIAEYAKANTSTCGCTDKSGEILSNVKNFKWAWDGDYTRKLIENLPTGVIVNADAADPNQQTPNNTQTFQWQVSGNSAAYHLNVGDMVKLSGDADPYAFITDIDGFNITINRQSFTAATPGIDELYKEWAPATVEWKVAGEMLFISGGQDVYDADRLYTETIWINNPQNYDIPFVAIIVS
jgi:hypothetical protein